MKAHKVLITGSKGQLGIELLQSAPTDYTAIGVDIGELDICDAPAVRNLVSVVKPTIIINCAAYTAVDRAESNAETAFRVNRDGPRNLAEAAAAIGARIVQISTDFVFDGKKSSPYLPSDTPNPLSVYGRSKLEGEQAVMQAAGDAALVVRTAWLYSAHGNNFVKTMLRLMRERPEIRVVADQVGTPTSASTLANTLWCLVKSDAAGGIYHCTDAGVASWYDLAYTVWELTQARNERAVRAVSVIPIQTKDYPTPAKRPAYSVLDQSATIAYSGVAPNWREPIKKLIAELVTPIN